MKTLVGKITLAAALAAILAPVTGFAQNLASQPGSVDRSVERYTLLPGPTLLSPARGAPQTTPRIEIQPPRRWDSSVRSEFRFVPTVPATWSSSARGITVGAARGTLTLGGDDGRRFSGPNPPPQPLPSAESLRFETALPRAAPVKIRPDPSPAAAPR